MLAISTYKLVRGYLPACRKLETFGLNMEKGVHLVPMEPFIQVNREDRCAHFLLDPHQRLRNLGSQAPGRYEGVEGVTEVVSFLHAHVLH